MSSGNQAYLSQDEYAKCGVMKVFKHVADPIFRQILEGVTEGKLPRETLERYALKQGISLILFESYFSEEHEIKTIRENTGFYNYDITLKFKCIRFFMNYFPELAENEFLKHNIFTPMNELKNIRNNVLCHNREQLSKLQCHFLAQSLKVPLGILLDVVKHTWDRSLDILNEKKNMETSINQIMNGTIPVSYDDFEYMCLQRVVNFEVEPALNTITKLISYDKREDNFKNYFLNNGLTKNDYKNTFFSEEKILLQRKYSEIKPDVTLHCKIIMLCKEWHHKLKNDQKAKGELSFIIGNIRGIRNHISHNMLSMSPDECQHKAQNLRDCIRDLEHFAYTMKL